jgi:hypothetical protein
MGNRFGRVGRFARKAWDKGSEFVECHGGKVGVVAVAMLAFVGRAFAGVVPDISSYDTGTDTLTWNIAEVIGGYMDIALPALGYIGGMVIGIAVVWRVIRSVKRGVGTAG